jgi:argininosuccinate lyase
MIMLKGLPLAYNKDMQEDKEPLFDTVNTIKQTLIVYTEMLSKIKFKKDKMLLAATNDYMSATSLANYLVTLGATFREAHATTGEIVRYCLDNKIYLHELGLEKYQSFCSVVSNDVYRVLEVTSVVNSHDVKGGTAKHRVETELVQCASKLQNITNWLAEYESIITNNYF